MQKVIFIIVVVFFMTQLFSHVYLKAWEKDEGKKTGWQRVGWHVLITISFPVYVMHFSLALIRKKELSKYVYLSFVVVLLGFLIAAFALTDFSFIPAKIFTNIFPLFFGYCLWFILAYAVGGIIQGMRDGTLFAD